MIKSLLGLDSSQDVAGVDIHFRGGWPLALLLIAGAIAFSIYLYRSETRLLRTRRNIMAACQFLALLTLILIILEPVADIKVTRNYQRNMLVLLDSSRSMAATDKGSDTSRIDQAKAALAGGEEGALLDKLAENYELHLFTFDGKLNPADGSDSLAKVAADGDLSQVGVALKEAVGRFAGQPLAGAVVLSDFISVKGEDPVEVATTLKDQGIPVHTVPVGLPRPPDIHVRRIIAPEVVFKGDRVPLRVQIESQGYAGRSVVVELNIDGQGGPTQQLELQDGVQFTELIFTPERESGTVELAISAAALAGEATDVNNTTAHNVRILDEKIKVLYIEGMPRWEFRYLRWVLLRDPRLDVRFLMTQGDPALAGSSPRHISRFPQNKEDAFEYDLIILGDVPAGYFKTEQIELIHEMVRERGRSLLMVAGPMAAPTSYRDTPIADVLPVKIGPGSWSPESSSSYPVVTAAGRESGSTSLALSEDVTDRIWSHVRPMHMLPPLEGPKPGATVLLSKSGSAEGFDQYPLVAWHRYGAGKSLFVATEDLWRMRLEVGDRYHARFWGQTIQFLTLSSLLGENKQITLETDRSTYSAGDTVQIFANVLTESFEAVESPDYTLLLERKGAPDSAAEIVLGPVPGSPGLFSGAHVAAEDGTYLIRTEGGDDQRSNRPEFEIATVAPEDRETGARHDVARQMAELSGGRPLTLESLAALPADLGSEAELSSIAHIERDLWDVPLLFLLILLFAGIEWFLRRRENLV